MTENYRLILAFLPRIPYNVANQNNNRPSWRIPIKKLSLVNIKQGTKSVPRFSNGNTLPLVQLPFGMTAFAPQTEVHGTWFYHPDDRSLEGIRLTHQPIPWIGDYGTFLMTPQNDNIANSPAGAWSGYRPAEAVMTPSAPAKRIS